MIYISSDIDKRLEVINNYSVVDYIKVEAKEVVDKIVAKRTINSLVLLMASDIHVSAGETVRTAIKHMGQGMSEICNYITPDGAIFLGDYNYNTTTSSKPQGIEDMKYMRLCIADIKKSLLTILLNGNHDYYSTSISDTENRFSEDEVYNLIGSHNSDKVVIDAYNLGRNYGYVDFEKQRIRLIYLNTTDIAEVDYTSHLISTVQGQWFINTALDLSDKADEENWGVVVCSHIPLFDNPQIPTVLGNFVDRKSGSNFGISYNFTNIKANLICVFHGHIHNFKVTTKITTAGNKITYICIPNAVPGRENPYTTNENYNEVDEDGNSVSYPKTTGTADDTSFNVIIIDRNNEKIHAICYGAGYDRTISYMKEIITYNITTNLINCTAGLDNTTTIQTNETVQLTFNENNGYLFSDSVVVSGATYTWDKSTGALTLSYPTSEVNVIITATEKITETPVEPTNQIPISTDTDGSIYNGIGYKVDTYLSSSGSISSKTDCVTTGFIPISGTSSITGDTFNSVGQQVVYLYNIEASPSDSKTRFAFYDESKNMIAIQYISGFKLDNIGYIDIRYELNEDGYISLLDIGNATYSYKTNNGKEAKFFRICAPGIDGDSIITVNEKIS